MNTAFPSLARLLGASLLVVAIAGAMLLPPPAGACDPNQLEALGRAPGGLHCKSEPIPLDPGEVQAGLGPVGVTGTGMFLYQMIQFDPDCVNYLGEAMDWVLGEAVDVYGTHIIQGDKLKHDLVEDKRWYLRTTGAFIAAALADAHTVLPAQGYLDAVEKTLLWIGAEALLLADSIYVYVENGMHTPINQSMAEGLIGIAFNALHVREVVPGTTAATFGMGIANLGAGTLAALAVPDPATGGKKWPIAYRCGGAVGATVPQWCGGAAGAVNFFLKMYQVTGNPTYRAIAEDGLLYIMGTVPDLISAGSIGLGWGSGVSGIMAMSVLAYQILGDIIYLDFAEEMGEFVLAEAITTEHGIKFYDDNYHCQHGNLGVLHGLDDLASESADIRYLDALNNLVDHLHATQVSSEYGIVIPAWENGDYTETTQGWGQASLLLTNWGEPDVLGRNPQFIELCENFRDFLLATRIEEENGWKWPMTVSYVVTAAGSSDDDEPDGLPMVSLTALPNPAEPRAGRAIRFYVTPENPELISLRIYDLRGRLVRTLANDETVVASRTFEWDGRDRTGRRAAAGVYFYEIASKQATVRKKLVLMH